MTDLVLESGGTLDKYIGDAVMAIWGAPVDLPDHAARACEVALRMQEALVGLNKRWKREGKPEIAIGIGINTGAMSVGNMGTHAPLRLHGARRSGEPRRAPRGADQGVRRRHPRRRSDREGRRPRASCSARSTSSASRVAPAPRRSTSSSAAPGVKVDRASPTRSPRYRRRDFARHRDVRDRGDASAFASARRGRSRRGDGGSAATELGPPRRRPTTGTACTQRSKRSSHADWSPGSWYVRGDGGSARPRLRRHDDRCRSRRAARSATATSRISRCSSAATPAIRRSLADRRRGRGRARGAPRRRTRSCGWAARSRRRRSIRTCAWCRSRIASSIATTRCPSAARSRPPARQRALQVQLRQDARPPGVSRRRGRRCSRASAARATWIVTNSDTHAVAGKVAALDREAPGVAWLTSRVRGHARKFDVDDAWTGAPSELALPGLERAVLLRRRAYYEILRDGPRRGRRDVRGARRRR